MINIFEEIWANKMNELLKKAINGDRASYVKFIDTLEQQFNENPQDSRVSVYIAKLRHILWPQDQVIKNHEILDFVSKETFQHLKAAPIGQKFAKMP